MVAATALRLEVLMTRSNSTAEWQALDAAHYLHPFTDHKSLKVEKSRIVTRGQGVYIWDSEGNKILDGMAGLWCVNVGYGRAELVEAATRQLETLPFYNSFFKTATPPAVELADRLTRLAGPGFPEVFFANSGSEAIDTCIRMVRHFWALEGKPEKRVVISRTYAYHGSTVAAASAGGLDDMHAQAGDMPGFSQIMPPYWHGLGGDMTPEDFGRFAAQELEKRILELGADKVAAFFAEPIQGSGGVIIPPESYWPEIQRICRAHDILLVADEVICGFGRTGHWFGKDRFGFEPDLMATAKGITSGYLPLSAVLVGTRVSDTLVEKGGEFYHGFTYSGHPVACAVALANLDIIEREGLVERAGSQGAKLLASLQAALADHPLVGEVRGTGLIGAIELVADKARRKAFPSERGVGMSCRNHCFDTGLVMRAVRDTMVFAPPFTITDAEIAEFTQLAVRAIDLTWRDVEQEPG
jgi:putrescine---pyruvate transaminase